MGESINKDPVSAQPAPPDVAENFLVVGIGASAGGVQALREFFNLASTEVSGWDVDASWRFNLGAAGRLTATMTGTYLEHYKYALATNDPIIDQAGTFGGPSDALPRFRGPSGVAIDGQVAPPRMCRGEAESECFERQRTVELRLGMTRLKSECTIGRQESERDRSRII